MALRRLGQYAIRSLEQYSTASAEAGSITSLCRQRLYSSLPEDLAEVAKRSKFPAKRSVDPAQASSAAAAASEATAASNFNAQVEGAKVASIWMAPWERRQLEGGALKPWEKLYWGVFVVAISVFLFNRIRPGPEDIPVVDETKEARKLELARLVLAGKSVIEEDEDLFDGLAPEEIQKFIEEKTGASSADPFEGLSPEEINEYVKKHGIQP